MRKLFLAVAALGIFLAAQPAHAQSAIARHMLLEAAARPAAPAAALRAEPVPAGQTTNAPAQPSGTPHGILLSFTPGTQGSDTNALAGVDVFRCAGTCTASSNWGSSLNATPVAGSTYLDPAAGLTAGSTYSYYISEVDTAGNQSAPSNIATVAVPSTGFPANPNAPTGAAGAVQ